MSGSPFDTGDAGHVWASGEHVSWTEETRHHGPIDRDGVVVSLLRSGRLAVGQGGDGRGPIWELDAHRLRPRDRGPR